MTVLAISDMTCGHCRAAVETTLSALPGVVGVRVDLAAKLAEVDGAVPLATLLAALDAAGFPASEVT
jgi:copper chaperone